MIMTRSIVVMGLLALAGMSAEADPVPAPSEVTLHIDPQPLNTALNAFGQQSGLQVVFLSGVGEGLRAPRLVGTFSPEAALEQLLANTELSYQFINARTVAIREKARDVSAVSTPAGTASDADASGSDLRLAQAEVPGAGQPVGEDKPQDLALEEIVVTGTHIRGTAPAGSPLKVYSRQDIDRSGAVALDQFARQMTENLANVDSIANFNSNAPFALLGYGASFGESAFNLRGTGPGATLTLVNGRRLAPAGIEGVVGDISMIPLSAIDHIEVLPDGASATYGADAISGVVNILTRRNFDGAQTSASYGSTSEGGADRLTASQLLGRSWESGHVFLNYEYDRQHSLDADQRDYIPEQGGDYFLIPDTRRHSVIVSGDFELASRTRILADALYGDRRTDGRLARFAPIPFPPFLFSQSNADRAEARQRGLSITLEQGFATSWRVSLTGNYSKVDQTSRTRVVQTFATIDSFADADADVLEGGLLADGSLMRLPAGPVKAAVGVDFAEQHFDTVNGSVLTLPSLPGVEFPNGDDLPEQGRRVRSAHLELLIPLVGESNAMAWARRLELSLAGRFDDYSDVGSSTNPKVGLAWSPLDSVTVRASYGTSFKAPLLSTLARAQVAGNALLPDSNGVNTIVLQLQGGNPNLDPEEGTSFTAGVDFKPASVPGLSFGATYFHIKFEDRVSAPTFLGFNPLVRPEVEPFITLDPTDADVLAAIEAAPGFVNSIPNGDLGLPPDATPDEVLAALAAQTGAIVDLRVTNLSRTDQTGIDVTGAYELPTGRRGTFGFSLAASRLLKSDYLNQAGFPSVSLLNDFGQMPKTKGTGRISWNHGNLGTVLSVHYVNDYDNTADPLLRRIDSWTTADLNLSYDAGDDSGVALLRGSTLALNISNLTDEAPPFAAVTTVIPGQSFIPIDQANASPLGRQFSLSLTKRW